MVKFILFNKLVYSYCKTVTPLDIKMLESCGDALNALQTHLQKSLYDEPLNSFNDIIKFLERCYPSLDIGIAEMEDDESHKKKWVVVCCAKFRLLDLRDLSNQLE